MSMLARDSNGVDWVTPMKVVTDPVLCTIQRIADSLDLWEGSWKFNVLEGMPYLQEILAKKNVSRTLVNAIFRRALFLIPRVVDVIFVNFVGPDPNRNAQVDYQVKIDTGAIINGSVPIPFNPATSQGTGS